jgi:zinc D-Ala-D-Ala carboxypeptidase
MSKYFKPEEIIKLDPRLVEMLDTARGLAGIPFIITSGFRTKEEDIAVGGTGTGAHTRGLAVDLRCKDSLTRFQIIAGAMSAGFVRIGDEEDHIHLDCDLKLDQRVMWRIK